MKNIDFKKTKMARFGQKKKKDMQACVKGRKG